MRTLVSGMHRSGTSAVMRVLHALGVDLGPEERLMGAASSNQFGHFELVPYVDLNDQLLTELGSHWAAPAHTSRAMEALAAGRLGDEATGLATELDMSADSVVKDPRFCLTLPFWRAALEDEIEQVILPIRHPRAVADSIATRNGLSREYCYELWEWYHDSLLASATGLAIVPVDFDQLLANPNESIDHLTQALPIKTTKKRRTAAAKMVEPEVRRHTYETNDVVGLPDSIAKLWHRLQQMEPGHVVKKPNSAPSVPTVFEAVARGIHLARAEEGSKVQRALEHASSARHKAAHLGGEVARQAELLVEQNQEAADAAERAAMELGRSEQARAQVTAERDALQARAGQEQAAAGRATEALREQAKVALAGLLDERQRFDSERARLEQSLANARERLLTERDRFDSDRAQLNAAAQQQLKELETEHNEALRRLDSERARLEHKVAEASERLREQQDQFDSDRAQLNTAAQQQINELETERNEARERLVEHQSRSANEIAELADRAVAAEQREGEQRHHVQHVEGERDHFYRESEAHRHHNDMLRGSRAGRVVFGWWNVRNRLKVGRPGKVNAEHGQHLAEHDSQTEPVHEHDASEALPPPVHFAPVADPDVSIVIPVYGQLVFTERCLRSIAETPSSCSYEVVVVDDESPDRTAEWLAGCTGITVVTNEHNLGFLRSTNAGAAAATAPRLLLLNNDTSVHPGWLDALVHLLDSSDDIGAVGAKLFYGDGTLQEAGSIIWNDANGWNYGKGQDPDDYRFNFVREVDYCSAACLLIQRSAWDDIGGFDERYVPAYYEDPDLCFELRERGFRVLYQPAARVTHYEGVSHGTDVEVGLKAHQVINRETFLAKWQARLQTHAGPDTSPRLASWRGKGRRVVVFDHEIPTWDRDAGSLRMTAILDLLQEMGFRVTVVPHNRYRSEPYASELSARGFEVFDGHDSWSELLGDLAPDLAAIIVSRPHVAAEIVPHAASAAPDVPVLYDMVDFHGLRMQRRAESGDVNVLKHAKAVMELERAMVRSTDATIAVTEVEAELVRDLEPEANVVVLPLINRSARSLASFEERTGSMFIGSWRHLPNRDAIEYLCSEIMPIVWESDPSHQLHLVGSEMPTDLEFADDSRITVHGWVENLEPLYETVRCNVAPLRFGAGQKGKVADSLIRGVPVVTTPVGAEGFGVVEEELLLGDSAAELAALVLEICSEEQLWVQRSEQGAKGIEEHFGYGAARRYLQSVLQSVGIESDANSVRV